MAGGGGGGVGLLSEFYATLRDTPVPSTIKFDVLSLNVMSVLIRFQLTAQLTQQEALLEQQKLKLRLQQQNLLQQQLEQQLQDYQRQLSDMYGPAEAPGRPSVPGVGALERVSLEELLPGGPPMSLADSVST